MCTQHVHKCYVAFTLLRVHFSLAYYLRQFTTVDLIAIQSASATRAPKPAMRGMGRLRYTEHEERVHHASKTAGKGR